jgi:hypothetical protein
MSDVSTSFGLDAKQFYDELVATRHALEEYAAHAETAGDKASKGFVSKLSSGLSSVQGVLGALGIGLSIGGVEHAIQSVVEYGTKIEDLSRRYGVASETLQKFGNAAELNGSSIEGVAKAFRFLEVSQAKALGGSEGHIKAFQDLGVSMQDLQTLRPDAIMLKIGESSLNAADTVKILGKTALELRPTLAGLADGTIEFGKAISDLDTERLKQLDDFFKLISQSARIAGGTIVAELLPAIGRAQDIAQKPAEAITRLFDQTPVGADAAPEDTALAAQLHKMREAAAGGALPAELAAAGTPGEKKARRDFGEAPDEGEAGETDDQGRPTKPKTKKTETEQERIEREDREDNKDALDVIGEDTKSKLDRGEEQRQAREQAARDQEQAEKEKDKEQKDQAKEARDAAKEAQNRKFKLDKADEDRAMNPAGLSLQDYATSGSGHVQALAQEAQREEAKAKENQLRGDFLHAGEHQDRAEQLKKSLGLPSKDDAKDNIKKGLDESEILKKIAKNTEDATANK